MEHLKKQILLLLFLLTGMSTAFAQKPEFRKADLLYRAKSYAQAIPLYEKGLANKDSKSARTKLAFCYKMLNQMDKAEAQYTKIVNEKRIRPDVFFYYGEVLMSNAKYEDAKTWFLKYHELEPEEGKGLQMANACDQIPFIRPLFPNALIKAFPHNTKLDDTSPVFYNNGIVFSSDRKQLKLLKLKSGATGRDFIRLYYSGLNEQNEWLPPKSLSGKLNEHNKNNANASFLPDGSEIFFTRNGSISNRKNAYTLQLYGGNNEKGKWKNIAVLSVCRPGHNYMHPAISPDGKTLFFVSDKPGGKGGTDIYYSKRKGDKWGKAINLDTMINTSAHEGFPFMNEDGKLYFCSKGHIGYGGFDIFVSEQKEDGSWQKPINIGQPINSPRDDISIFLNKENTKGAFTSSREGGDDDIYLFSLTTADLLVSGPPSSNLQAQKAEEAINPDELKEEVIAVDPSEPKKTFVSNEIPATKDVITKEAAVATEVSLPLESTINKDLTSLTDSTSDSETIRNNDFPTNDEPSAETRQHILQDVFDKVTIPVEQEAQLSPLDSISSVIPSDRSDQKMISNQSLEVNDFEEDPPVTDPKTDQALGSEVEIRPIPEVETQQDIPETTYPGQLLSFKAFQKAVSKGKQQKGMYYVLEKLNYFPGEYLLAPKMTLQLDPIAKMMAQQPELILEVAVHTESIGYDENNLAISKKRAKAIKNYLLYKDIAAKRIIYTGFGETQLLNHCGNGVVCTEEEHMVNQRVEIRVK